MGRAAVPSPKNVKLSDKETLAIVEDMRQKRVESVKNFFTGMAKAVTTDLPGFLMDFADKLVGDTASFGEKDRSAQLFEKMTGIKTKSGSGGVDEFLGGMIDPISAIGAAKAVILPAVLVNAEKYGDAIDASIKGMRGPELWKNFGVFPDPITGELKSVLPDTSANFTSTALKAPTEGYKSLRIEANPTRVSTLDQTAFDAKDLSKILDHPELFAAVPDLAAVQVRPSILSNALGSYDPTKDTIRLMGGREPNDIFSTLLHEVQHSIQKRAGTQGGGNTGMFFDNEKTFEAAANKAGKLYNELRDEFDGLFKNSQGLEKHSYPFMALELLQEDLTKGGFLQGYAEKRLATIPVKVLSAHNQVSEAKRASLAFVNASEDAYDNYRALLGEAEARLVQMQHRLGDYTTYPPELMAKELGVSLEDLPKLLITDNILPAKKVDTSPEIQEAIAFVEKLMQSRSTSSP